MACDPQIEWSAIRKFKVTADRLSIAINGETNASALLERLTFHQVFR
jgi:hypothetical protein